MTRHKTQTKKLKNGNLLVTVHLLRERLVSARTEWYAKEHRRRHSRWLKERWESVFWALVLGDDK